MSLLSRSPIVAATQPEVMGPYFHRHRSAFFPSSTELSSLELRYEFKYEHNLNVFYRAHLLDAEGDPFIIDVIGKAGIARSMRVAYDLQRHLWKQGFSSAPHFINRPLAYVPKWNLHLYEALPGPVFKEQLTKRSKAWIRAQHRLVALWLKKLHASKIAGSGLKPERLAHLFRLLFLSFDDVPAVFRQESSFLRSESNKLQAELCGLPLVRSLWTITHGDFGQHNIILLPKAVGVIDFDSAALFDPAYDVASYLTQMIFGRPGIQDDPSWSTTELQSFEQSFLRIYQRNHPVQTSDHWERRYQLFRRFFLLKIGLHLLTWFSGSVSQKKKFLRPIFRELSNAS